MQLSTLCVRYGVEFVAALVLFVFFLAQAQAYFVLFTALFAFMSCILYFSVLYYRAMHVVLAQY